MATSTMRQMLVKTLINIGEPVQAASVPAVGQPITDTYQLQICNFINHIKEECEQLWQWSSRWQTYTMSYTTGNVSQQIVTAIAANVPTATPIGATPWSGCEVVRIKNPKMGREVGLCFDITTFGIPFVLDEMPMSDLMYYNTVLNQTPVAYSTNYTLQDLGNDNIQLQMYPGANTTRNIQITLYNPQQYIDPTNGTGNQVDVWNSGTQGVSFTGPLSLGATSATLSAPWPYASGTYATTFSGPNSGSTGIVNQTVNAVYVLGLTTCSWTPALNSNLFVPTVMVAGFLSGGMGCDSPIIMPSRIIELGTAWYALSERGEELGTNSMFSEDKYRRAIDDLSGADKGNQGDLVMVVT